ncbi:MAG: DUF4198 domain-containing protein [Pirellulaceae bacterium]|nr:DUF4198 domain-containing protein [Pirellulaceae bacterium]
MQFRHLGFASLLLALVASPALAHFVWVAVEKDSSGQPTAKVWFSELAEPDVAKLLDKVTAVKVWTRQGTEKPSELKLTKQVSGELGALVSAVPAGTSNLSAHLKYGVVTRREQTMLLHYFAKYLDGTADNLKQFGRDEGLALDVVPQLADGGIELQVLYQGKPVAGSDVVVLDGDGNETDHKTAADGRVKIAGAKPGLYSIRAKWVVMEAGKDGDQEYPQVSNYCTLALRMPGSNVKPNAP